ncbi:MAG TPA: hypothetical protein VF981_09380 [Gemmatimonadaceae bacterium]
MGSMMSMQWPSPARRRQAESHRRALPHLVAGAWHEMGGRLQVLRGVILRDDTIRALGYRQQLIGMLQRLWGRERGSVEAWVDAHLRRQSGGSPGGGGHAPAVPRSASTHG